jgi:hypothetical protein
MPKKQLVSEALIDLHRRLSALPSRSHERRMIMQETAPRSMRALRRYFRIPGVNANRRWIVKDEILLVDCCDDRGRSSLPNCD